MSDAAVRFEDVGKMYKVFSSRSANLADALGLDRVLRAGRTYAEFWALRSVDFELERGERLGVIGRNGAGKSTLLKLVTGNIPPTEGRVQVHGQVQALLEIGGGLHPEFSGRENIRASLGFLGLSADEIEEATHDIAQFTELGRFLDQPFKTYSLGMQARLSFAIATAVTPEILIVDEILGAGDAYFFSRSTERMRGLIDGGASVLLVSHALDQVTRFCPETIWLDRGRIVMRGPTNEVVKAYEAFIRRLDDRRLQAKNRKSEASAFDAFQREGYTAEVSVRIKPTADCDVSEISLSKDTELEDSMVIGAAQDADVTQSVHLVPSTAWGNPVSEDGTYFRPIAGGVGSIQFHLWFLYPDSDYRLDVRYRARGGPVDVELEHEGGASETVTLPSSSEWTTKCVTLRRSETRRSDVEVVRSRWDGRNGFLAQRVRIVDSNDEERAIFETGDELSVLVDILATTTAKLPLVLASIVFRSDGVIVTRHVASPQMIDASEGDRLRARLDLGPLLLGNGSYLVSIGLYAKVDLADIDPSEFYDYYDKSFEFRVVGNPTMHNELVLHPGQWSVVTDDIRSVRREAAQR